MRQLSLTRHLLTVLLLLFSLAACEKNDTEPQVFSDKIVLQAPQMKGDSLQLTWSRLDDKTLRQYRVLRYTTSDPSGGATGTALTPYYLPTSGSNTATTFVDREVPYTTTVSYKVEGVLTSGQTITSNLVNYSRPEIKTISAPAYDVQLDRQRRLLYFFGREGVITQYSLTSSKVLKTLNSAATIGYCDFGMHNGIQELYVPRNDGWVFIYNAETLEKIDQLNVGAVATSVVAHNSQLFISTETNSWHLPIKVYSRASKTLINETYGRGNSRLKLVPTTTTNTELLEATLNISPVDQRIYLFSPEGFITSSSDDHYHGDYPLDASIFEIFPSGTQYVTSTEGAIYSKSMVYEGTLPHGKLQFTSFGFDGGGRFIYGGTTNRSIEVYSTSGYTLRRSIKTRAYPYRLFDDGANGILCVSSITPAAANYYPYGTPNQLVIEAFK
jgi:hypothetical protein